MEFAFDAKKNQLDTCPTYVQSEEGEWAISSSYCLPCIGCKV